MIQHDPVKRITSADVKKMVKLLPKRSAIKPLTLPKSSCNQGKKSTVENGMHGAESLEKSYSNRRYEVANGDSDCTASFIGSHVILPNNQQTAKQRSTFPKPANQRRYSHKGLEIG